MNHVLREKNTEVEQSVKVLGNVMRTTLRVSYKSWLMPNFHSAKLSFGPDQTEQNLLCLRVLNQNFVKHKGSFQSSSKDNCRVEIWLKGLLSCILFLRKAFLSYVLLDTLNKKKMAGE